MLLNDLYFISTITEKDQMISAGILLQAEHPIFKGHFPGQPVLPGVCMMEMIAEVCGEQFQKTFRIESASMIKFLHMIDPARNPEIAFEIKYAFESEKLITSGRIFFGTEIFMKFNLIFAAA